MTFSSLLVAGLASPQCIDIAPFASAFGKAFIWLAFVAAIAQLIISAYVTILEARKNKPSGERQAVAPDKLLDSLKGVLEALANLPAWIAIFLAGLALLWIAQDSVGKCASSDAAAPAVANAAA